MEKILTAIGALGFISIFHAIALAGLYGVYKGAKESLKQNTFAKSLVPVIAGTFFSLWFTVLPFFISYGVGGWLTLTLQVIIFVTLIFFISTPYPQSPDKPDIYEKTKGVKQGLLKFGLIETGPARLQHILDLSCIPAEKNVSLT